MIILQSIIKSMDVSINKDVFYLVTGNDKQEGICFYGENVLNIRMKKAFGSSDASFWLDDMFKANVMKFDEDIKATKELLNRGATIIYSPASLGEDLFKMKDTCPKTTEYMEDKLSDLLYNNPTRGKQ
tara:strand:- start:1161 stop:1544 length:384 start_codon:yes stop_codon:yes gene_type:complete